MLAAIGEGGYADGIRARLIRDRLIEIPKATPRDMLSIQLDDRALFLDALAQAATRHDSVPVRIPVRRAARRIPAT